MTDATLRKIALSRRTALTGPLAAALLLAPALAAAQAGNDCGSPENGVVTCTPDGNPYPNGIFYGAAGDLTLNLADGVVAENRVRVDVGGDASINLADGASVNSEGFLKAGVSANANGSGDVVIDAQGAIRTRGFLAQGIRATASEGSVAVSARDVNSFGGAAISVGGGTGPVRIETSGTIQAENGTGIAGESANSVAAVEVLSDGRVDIANDGLIEQIGSPDEEATGLFHAGIYVQTDLDPPTGISRDIAISGEGTVVANGHGANGIELRGDSISVRQASVTARGALGAAVGASAEGAVHIDVDEAVSERSSGILAFSRGGDVAIAFDRLSAFGLGAYGQSDTGAVTVSAGDIAIGPDVNGTNGAGVQLLAATDGAVMLSGAITGEESFGIAIEAGGNGSVSITEGASIDVGGFDAVQVDAQGDVAVSNQGTLAGGFNGLFARGASVAIVNDGSIGGDGNDGIHVESAGDVTIGGGGSATAATGEAIDVAGNQVSIAQAAAATTGDGAAAVGAFGEEDVEIAIGTASSASGTAIDAESANGNVEIAFDSVSAAGDGASARSETGAVTVTGGDANVSGRNAAGIYAVAATAATVKVTGDVRAERGLGAGIYSEGRATLRVEEGASLIGGIDGAEIETVRGATIVNAGTMRGATGYAIDLFGGAARIVNSGTILGAVSLADGDDRIVNSGRFVATRDSNFYAGFDSFANSGTLAVLPGDGAEAGTVQFLGLERFTNSGRIDLANGRVGDTLSLSGGYRGAGGVLEIDVGANGADRLLIGGAARGQTMVVADGLDGRLEADRVIVSAGAGSRADAFTTGGLNVGLVEYGIGFDGGSYSLVTAAGDAAYRTARYSEGARQLWYQSSDAWQPHMRALRDGTVSEYTGGLWNQSYGTLEKRDGIQSAVLGGAATEADVSTNQDYFGRQFGYDLIGGPGQGFVAGGTIGYIDSALKFAAAPARAEFDAFFGGLYAGWRGGPFFANALAKYDYYLISARDGLAGFEEDLSGSAFGATAEFGLRGTSRGLFVEPVASLSWVRADIEDLEALGSRIEFDADDGLRGKIGLRLGSLPDPEDRTPLSFYVGGNAVKEFGGEDEATLFNNGRSVLIETEDAGLYGEAIAGLTIFGRKMSGFFEGYANVGGREDLRGFGARAGMRMELGGLFGGLFGR